MENEGYQIGSNIIVAQSICFSNWHFLSIKITGGLRNSGSSTLLVKYTFIAKLLCTPFELYLNHASSRLS